MESSSKRRIRTSHEHESLANHGLKWDLSGVVISGLGILDGEIVGSNLPRLSTPSFR